MQNSPVLVLQMCSLYDPQRMDDLWSSRVLIMLVSQNRFLSKHHKI